MKSILITGSYGQLGEACIKHLKSNFNLFISDSVILGNGMHLDITDEKTVDQVLAETNPDIILNLAAMTDVDECENNPSLARAINVDGVKNLCNGFKGHFIQISTDYVFDGQKNLPYSETDFTNPLSIYGKSKLEGEKFVEENCSKFFIIRTSGIISRSEDNFLSKIKKFA